LRNKRTADLDGDEQEWESEAESSNAGGSLLSVDSSRRRAPSPSYLYTHHTAGYHHRRGRSTDGSGKYIEYLEKQVADLTGQLQNYTSATESTSHAAKMRKLAAENRAMRQDIAEWEAQFEDRVEGEVTERRVLDESLRETVNELENRLEDAECQLRLANAEVKGLRKRCDQLKGIEEENHRLEFRIEALTELLADSTKTIQRCSSAEYSRPSSVIHPRRHTSIGGSAPTSAAMSRRASRESGSFHGMEDYGITDPVDMIFAVEQKLDGRTSPSVSSQASSNYSSRRRLSFAAGMHPPRSPVPGQMSPTLRARRMRKFAAGSTAPKTLILPSASVVISAPTSLPGSPTRPKSVSSDLGVGESHRDRSNFDTMRSVSYPNTHRNSLFAELARVESESEESDAENDNDNDDTTPPTDSPQKEDTTTLASTAPSSLEMKPTVAGAFPEDAPEPPTFDFDLVSDATSNTTPLLVKVFDTVGGLSSPTRTFFMAKRKAIDIVGNVVGRGVDRVSQRRTQVLTKRSRRSVGGGIFSDPPPPSLRNRKVRASPQAICAECGARKAEAEESLPVRNTLSREGSAWKRSTAVGGLRKRSGSMVQPVSESIDVLWLWVRFIIAVVVALGLAVKDGPPQSVVTLGDEEGIDHVREEERARALKRLEGKR